MGPSQTIVVIPSHNEAVNLRRLLPELLALPFSLVIFVVDDDSTDGTQDVVREIAVRTGRVTLLARPRKLGLGSAYRDGFAQVIGSGYQSIVQMDADGSHRVGDLVQMLNFQKGNPQVDLVIGSRWVAGGSVENWPKRRELLSRVANFYSRLLLGLQVKDSTAGFRIYRAELLKKIDFRKIQSEGYAFQIEMTLAAVNLGAKISEVPISFVEREHGVSKMSGRIIREALFKVTKWGLARVTRQISGK